MTQAQQHPSSADESSPPQDDQRPDARTRFHEELRQRNVQVFLWSTLIFDLAYVGWAALDRLLVPQHWLYFLGIRLSVAVLGTVLAVAVKWSGKQRHTWEAFALWLVACGVGIGVMLPLAGTNFLAYVLGFSLIIYGAGLLPFWRPAWAVATVAAISLSPAPAFLLWTPQSSPGDLIAGLFFILTGAGASIVMASFKYGLARADFLSRDQLERTSGHLQQALTQIQVQEEMKSVFFANISHELRSPLTLILGPVQDMLASTPRGPVARKLSAVEQNAQRLLQLIDDLLDLSKLDAGRLRLKLTTFDLGALVDNHVERTRPGAESRKLRLQVEVPTALPPVLGDEHRIEMVLSNLVGNAMKYTPAGGWIAVRIVHIDGALRVDVQDDGPGIPPEQVAQVFDRFFQAHESQGRSIGGVGIGLSLARQLVELHGGEISLHSTLGQGSTFSFTLPLGKGHIRPEIIDRRGDRLGSADSADQSEHPRRRSSDRRLDAGSDSASAPALSAQGLHPAGSDLPAPPPVVLERGRRARIVVADDQDDLRQFIAGLLSDHYQVLEAANGAQAWELIKAQRPDLVLTDVMMPVRSGSALCKDIKHDATLRHIPVILLTARASSSATLEAYAAGADDFIAKPFHPRILLARVSAQLRLRALSAELAQRERLAAVGTLAAGILHEVRNPVNAIMSARQTLDLPDLDEETRISLLDVIGDATQRIHDLTTTLDSHIRPAEDGGPASCSLCEGLDTSLRLLEHRLKDVTVHRDFQVEGRVAAKAGPINQVLVNLLDNALKADAKHLWITIEQDASTVY
ncbi:MAG: response regulator, partial [Oligoflexia bacterium]|nr:response regulator [Oligoflexia bacterium]